MKPQDAALRKRTQISKANRVMLIWVAVASVILGFAIVALVFLGQKLIFNEKILAEKNKTVATLDANNKAIPELQSQVRVLDTNEALMKNRANEDEQAVQVILDALPSDANSLALGASLQDKLLVGIQGLSIESLQVDPVSGIEQLSEGGVESGAVMAEANEITFRFVISGSQAALKKALVNLERSIRTIDIQTLQIESQGSRQTMTVSARAFYEPAREVKLYDKVVKP